ncbi:MAG: hypothetical protein RMM53_10920, partial [Bacteroidia bacterium]|nr:hypothetical protein [Bacteroidia bacterium]MDW8334717.1 hypothetical protein [Bacteroidia bacterium]
TLLRKRFFNEPEHVLEYRLDHLRVVTRAYFDKIVHSFARLTREDDFVIEFPGDVDASVLLERWPETGSWVEWWNRYGWKALFTEPNGLVALVPENDGCVPVFFPARAVVDVRPGKFALVAENPDGFLLFTPSQCVRFRRRKDNDFSARVLGEHRWHEPPAWILGGEPTGLDTPGVYRSFLDGAVDWWDEALIEYSDKQAALKMHVYPEKWIYGAECRQCHGAGKLSGLGAPKTCVACAGTGTATGPFSVLHVRPPKAHEPPTPIPPAGYVQKDLAAVEFLAKDVNELLRRGLAAVHFEHLFDVPLNQSGYAKALDRAETDAFLYKVLRHAVRAILEPLGRFVLRRTDAPTFRFRVSSSAFASSNRPQQLDVKN